MSKDKLRTERDARRAEREAAYAKWCSVNHPGRPIIAFVPIQSDEAHGIAEAIDRVAVLIIAHGRSEDDWTAQSPNHFERVADFILTLAETAKTNLIAAKDERWVAESPYKNMVAHGVELLNDVIGGAEHILNSAIVQTYRAGGDEPGSEVFTLFFRSLAEENQRSEDLQQFAKRVRAAWDISDPRKRTDRLVDIALTTAQPVNKRTKHSRTRHSGGWYMGEALVLKRADPGLTADDVAKKLGVHRTTLEHHKNAMPEFQRQWLEIEVAHCSAGAKNIATARSPKRSAGLAGDKIRQRRA